MKRTTLFVSGMILTAAMTSLPFVLYTKKNTYPIQTLSGKEEALLGIRFTTGVTTPTIPISIQYDGTHVIKEEQGKEYQDFPNGYPLFMDAKVGKHPVYLSDWKQRENDNVVGPASYERELKQAEITLGVTIPGETSNMEFKTDLYYEKDDDMKLVLVGSMDPDGNIIGEYVEVNDPITIETYPQYSKERQTYYFMPATNEAMKGQAYVYSVKSHTTDLEGKPIYNLQMTKKLIKLPMDHIYDEVHIDQDTLYVVSHKGNDMYVTSYTLDGKRIKQVAMKRKGYEFTPYYNDKYMVWHDKDTLYAFDLSAMRIESHTRLTLPDQDTENPLHLQDLLYKNNRFYTSYNRFELLSYISVEEEDKTIYEGTIDLLNYKEEEPYGYEYWIHPLKFER